MFRVCLETDELALNALEGGSGEQRTTVIVELADPDRDWVD